MKLDLPPPPLFEDEYPEAHLRYASHVREELTDEIQRLDTPGINLAFTWTYRDDIDGSMCVECLRCLECTKTHRRFYVKLDDEYLLAIDVDTREDLLVEEGDQ